jgi:hypothetical protein
MTESFKSESADESGLELGLSEGLYNVAVRRVVV